MGRISRTCALLLTLLVATSFLTLLTTKTASAQITGRIFAQTFELTQGAYSGIAIFDLQIGDQIRGSVSVENLGPYPLGPLALALGGSGTSYEVVDIYIDDPNWHSLNGNTSFSLTPSNNSANFSFTAQEQGLYRMWAFSGALDYLENAKNPLMTLSYGWTGTPMNANILSPLNQIYTEANTSLAFTVNRPIDWAAYSLNGAKNVTLWDSHNGNPETANTTLTDLATGTHSLTLYVNDSWGNMNVKTVTFTVEKPQIEMIGSTNIITILAVSVALVCIIAFLLLFRRHRKTVILGK